MTGITLSTEQLAYADARFAGESETGRADLRLLDYRDVEGRYDRIASIEMLEAVGEGYWPIYFDRLRSSLSDGGIAVLQIITIAESRYAAYRRRPDFIQRHIFPGGMLPTLSHIEREAARVGLKLVCQELFGDSYARPFASGEIGLSRRSRRSSRWVSTNVSGGCGSTTSRIAKLDFGSARLM